MGHRVQRSAGPANPGKKANGCSRSFGRALERPHQAAVRYATTRIGTTDADWRADSARVKDTPIIDLIQSVQQQISGAELSIASVFSPNARFEPGAITVERVVDLYPYENTLRSLRLGEINTCWSLPVVAG